jgi:transcriptional regulator with XRE-family HTH domain
MAKETTSSKPAGIFIEQLMERKGLKNKDLAEMMDTTDATISRLLNGQRGLDLSWLHLFSKALDVPLWQLFQAPGEATSKSPKAALRSALLAYGVDHSQLDLAISIIDRFVPVAASEEQSEQSQTYDQSRPANRPHEELPSR